jgi:hypothetical protein
MLPKSISFGYIKYSDNITLILDSIYHSILSFSDTYVELKSEKNFEELLILSNKAKSITIRIDDEVNYWKIKEFPQNY